MSMILNHFGFRISSCILVIFVNIYYIRKENFNIISLLKITPNSLYVSINVSLRNIFFKINVSTFEKLFNVWLKPFRYLHILLDSISCDFTYHIDSLKIQEKLRALKN